MVRTGYFTAAIALGLFVAGCRGDARIQLLGPAATNEPDGAAGGDGPTAGSDEPPPPLAGSQAGASGRPAGTGGRVSVPPDAGTGSAGTSRPPPLPVQDAGPPRSADDPIPGLILRYDFTGEGTTVRDLVGDNDATLVGGATLSPDRDHVVLDGVDDYVDMPNGIISSLESATFIAWIAWNGGPCWQRVFDFGSNEAGEDAVGTVRTSLFMTPVACGRESFAVMAEFGRIQYQMFAARPLVAGYTIQVAMVVDAERRTFTMYDDGVAVAEAETPFGLADIEDVNNWLGRSQWPQDRYFDGLYGDFRIYDRALDPDEIATLYARRPNGL